MTEDTGPESLREFNKSKKKVVSKVGHSLLCHPTSPCALLCLNHHLRHLQHVDNYMICKHGYNISISSFISIFYHCAGSSKLCGISVEYVHACTHPCARTHTHSCQRFCHELMPGVCWNIIAFYVSPAARNSCLFHFYLLSLFNFGFSQFSSNVK